MKIQPDTLNAKYRSVILSGILLWGGLGCAPSEKQETTGMVATTSSTKTDIAVIYRSTDLGNTWVAYANGIPDDATVSSFLSDDHTTYATTDTHGIYAIRESDTKWTRVDVDLPEDADINAMVSLNHVFIIGTHKHGIWLSRNNGMNWEPSASRLSYTSIRSLLSYADILLAGTDDGIYKSIDQGNTWQQIYKGVQTNGFTVLHDKIYAALMNGAIMTDDQGATWKYIYQPHTLHDISNDGESVYAMTLGGGLLKSNNDGLTWQNINDGFGETRWYTFEVKHIDDRLFAAQWHGIYASYKRGGTWKIEKNGLPDSTAFSTLETTETGLIAGIGLRKK